MHLQGFRLLALGALAVSVDAFHDTSPFFYFSTAEDIKTFTPIQSASSLASQLSTSLKKCSTDFYILVSQPGVVAGDYVKGKSSPSLTRTMRDAMGKHQTMQGGYTVNEVIGQLDMKGLRRILQEDCDATLMTKEFPTIKDPKRMIFELTLPPPPPSGASRSAQLIENDALLAAMLSDISGSYTVLYSTAPASYRSIKSDSESDSPPYEMDSSYESSLGMELKRDLSPHGLVLKRAESNDTLVDGPLFSRYGFFSPGLFMGLLVGLLLLSILYVAITGLASLEVSYAAFDKEMGPQAQKGKGQ